MSRPRDRRHSTVGRGYRTLSFALPSVALACCPTATRRLHAERTETDRPAGQRRCHRSSEAQDAAQEKSIDPITVAGDLTDPTVGDSFG